MNIQQQIRFEVNRKQDYILFVAIPSLQESLIEVIELLKGNTDAATILRNFVKLHLTTP